MSAFDREKLHKRASQAHIDWFAATDPSLAAAARKRYRRAHEAIVKLENATHEADSVGSGNSAACTCGIKFNAGTQPKAYAALLRHIGEFQ